MKRFLTSMISTFLIIIFLAGCSINGSKKRDLSISVGDKKLNYKISDDNSGDGDSLFSFAFDINSTYIIEEVEIGGKIYLDFGDSSPEKFYIKDYLLSLEGKQQYGEKLIGDIFVRGDNEKYYFDVDVHMASYLSSFYDEDKRDNRGFVIVTNTNGSEKTYKFVIRTKVA